jgi:glycosyltransferase involved in cell wall biosynthesis
MPDIPLVSVVMSVFNGERFLREAVESILSQTFRDLEFIIINDGSTDGTAAILDSYVRSDSRVRVFEQGNKGNAESWNRGCSLARGNYIARMDADDVSLNDRLVRQIEFLEKNPNVGVAGSAVELIDATGRTLCRETRAVEDYEIRRRLLDYCVFAHSTVIFRREAFMSVGGYRKFFVGAIDYDFFLRIAESWKLANLPEVLLKYRIHPGQVCSSRFRQLCLSSLAAQAFAAARRDGKPEPVISAERATPEVLARLGVDQATQHRLFFQFYCYWLQAALRASDHDTFLRLSEDHTFLQLVDEFIDPSRSGTVGQYALSNAVLLAIRIHHRRGHHFKALAFVVRRGIIIAPMVLKHIFWDICIHRTFTLRKRLGLRRRVRVEHETRQA